MKRAAERRRRRETGEEGTYPTSFDSVKMGPTSAGLIIPPNTIDFKAVFSNFGERLLDSPVVLSFILLLFLLYLPLLIWARRKDKQDHMRVCHMFIFLSFM